MLRYLWNSLRDHLVGSKKRRRTGSRRGTGRFAVLRHEPLEDRRLLAATAVSLNEGIHEIVIRATAADDRVVVSENVAGTINVHAVSDGEIVDFDFSKSEVSHIRFEGEEGNDHFENETDIGSLAFGGAGNDVLIGGRGDDLFYGGDGNDQLFGNFGDDRLYGQDGIDMLRGGTGSDKLYGEEGNDQLYGEMGADTLEGGSGDDYVDGGSEDDSLVGNEGNDTLLGQSGNDILYGGNGFDRLYGNDGDDRLNGNSDGDQIYGGAGNDYLSGDDGDDLLFGEAGNDELDGVNGNDIVIGGEDSDFVLGGDGNDLLIGNSGSDKIYGGNGNDWIYGNDGDDELRGGRDDDVLFAGAGIDRLFGDSGDDELNGGLNNDELDGGDGNDRLDGDGGDDFLLGGQGNDLLVGGLGDDSLYGGAGYDQLYGNDGNDRLYGDAQGDVLYGGAGNDFLVGNDGNDALYGEAGNDELRGLNGNDIMIGGDGDDFFLGGEGNDLLVGNDGNDRLFGDAGNDWLYGNEGADDLHGSSGDDTLFGGAGDDKLTGHEGADVLNGDSGNDELRGLDGSDLLDGGSGDDFVLAGNGADLILGGDGDDALYGDAGNDVIIGGTGADRLFGTRGSDLLVGGSTVYDGNRSALLSLLTVWSGTASYSTRIQTIENESFGAWLESAVTVVDDEVADELSGGEDQDWFFQTGYMGVWDPVGHGSGGQHDGHDHGEFASHELPYLEGFALIDSLDQSRDREAGEALHSKVPHASDPVRQREHLSLFELVRYDQVTHYAVKDGAWSNPSTWHDGVVPANGAKVLIPIGVEVTVDRIIAPRLDTVRIDGTLRFSTTTNSELRVDTIIGSGSSHFEMGSAATPIPSAVSARLLITDAGPIDRTWDPFGISRGLISHGSVSIHGAERTSQEAIIGGVSAGGQVLLLANEPVGWKAGDSVVVAATTRGTEQNEVRTIVTVAGNKVVLDQSLNYNHLLPEAGLQVHVANLTRNVVIESEGQTIERRGHTMFMHNRNVDVAYAGFYHLGRTNKLKPINDSVVNSDWTLEAGTGTNQRARYSVHFHRNGTVNDGNPSLIRSSVVVDNPGWGYVNHSSYVNMIDNVSYDVSGAGFASEVGDEIGSFDGNIAIGTIGSGEAIESRLLLQDFGHQGDGFWFQGPGVTVTNNISAGNDGHAFVFYTRGLNEGGKKGTFLAQNLANPEIAKGATTVDVGEVPIAQFSGNVGYASSTGLAIHYHLENATHSLQGVFDNSSFWNNHVGIDLPYSRQVVLRNLAVIHSSDFSPRDGISRNLITRDVVYDNPTVTGYRHGIVVPVQGETIIRGGELNNETDIWIETGFSSDRRVTITGFTDAPTISIVDKFDFDTRTPNVDYAFRKDVVLLDFGPFENQRVYYRSQAADAIPFPSPIKDLPSAYVGLTSQELWNQYGVAVGGELAPADTFEVPGITGLIGAASS